MKRLVLTIIAIAGTIYAWQNNSVVTPPDYVLQGKAGPHYNGSRTSPGTVVGTTWLDWLYNGSGDKHMFWPTPRGAFHFCFPHMLSSGPSTRRPCYNYFRPPNYWLGPTQIDSSGSVPLNIDCLDYGRAVCALTRSIGGVVTPILYIDTIEGTGSFIPHIIPANDQISLLKVCVDTVHNRIWVSGVQLNAGVGCVTYSDDQGQT